MDYEKKYKEANKKVAIRFGSNVAKEIFQDLYESEGEKIRKEIIELVKFYYGSSLTCKHTVSKDDMVAWLEKQGQTFTKKDVDDAWLKGMYDAKYELEKQGEQKPFGNNIKEALRTEYEKGRADAIAEMADTGYTFDFEKKELKEIEHKYAENKGMNLVEEDMTPFQKKVFCIIDTTIEEEHGLKQVCDELLRLAHDEIMQKPAWSEEDKNVVEDIEEAVINNWFGDTQYIILDWLKSLKDRVQPQNAWKPSDEQMRELGVVAAGKGFFNKEILRGLLEQLKKLREK